jgi:poly-gamma-glutamate synthesis protein (capsule biosynthesis protein)
MKQFKKWMHEKGRSAVMVIMVLAALGIVLHYYVTMDNDSAGSVRLSQAALSNSLKETKLPQKAELGGSVMEPAKQKAEKKKKDKDKAAGEPRTAIQLGFAGDICLDDSCAVMRHMKRQGGLSEVISPELIQKMNSYDSMIINNEFSISERGKPMPGKAYTFRSRPSNVKYLKQLGVDVAGLANNHIYDYGKNAFLDTLQNLKKAGIQTMGAGKNIAEAKEPVYLKIKGKTIALVAATRAEKYIMTPEAGKISPGVFRTYNDRQYVKEIRKATKKADYVIAYVHWGTEYSTTLETAQIKQAKDYINAGADAVIGAHTHCLQGVGYYKGVPIIYSLGNFWFNEKSLYTTVLEVDITDNGDLTARMLPCLQSGKETRLLTKRAQIKKFLNYVNKISTNARLDSKGNVRGIQRSEQ